MKRKIYHGRDIILYCNNTNNDIKYDKIDNIVFNNREYTDREFAKIMKELFTYDSSERYLIRQLKKELRYLK